MQQNNQAIIRLNKLMKVGYEIDKNTSQEVVDAIWLEHQARNRAQEPTLILYSDGLVASHCVSDERVQLRFDPGQDKEFLNFISTVPKATLWERSHKWRTNVLIWLFLGSIWAFGALVVNFVINFFNYGS